jgi:hypothetical protein
MSAAARDHLLKVAATEPQTALVELRTLIASLGETHAPQGAAGVFALRLHVDAVIAAISEEAGRERVKPDPLPVDIACRVEGGRALLLDLDLPLAQIQEHVVRAGLLPDPEAPPSRR